MTADHVPLGVGRPTLDEMRTYYEPKFTWWQLRLFANLGDLSLLKRHKKLELRYREWTKGIKEQYGSVVEYLNYRLQWGKADHLALLPSKLKIDEVEAEPLPEGIPLPTYFTADIHPSLVSIIQNDWPYSVPLDVEHLLIWTKVPLLPTPPLLMSHIAASLSAELQVKVSVRLAQYGLWGFTGTTESPPDPSLYLAENLAYLNEGWGVTMENLTLPPKGTPEEEEAVRQSGAEVHKFITRRWVERE